jgi:sigma-E factor negative regulatory protein RseA
MRNELSALIDGEVESHEARLTLTAMKSDAVLRDVWNEYHLIGDVLRAEPGLGGDITSTLMERLREEPVVLAPMPGRRANWHRPLAALAASVAGVAVVGWLALVPESSPSPLPSLAAVATPSMAQPVVDRNMREYLLAHQANAPGLQLQGGSQHIRTVSLVEGGR